MVCIKLHKQIIIYLKKIGVFNGGGGGGGVSYSASASVDGDVLHLRRCIWRRERMGEVEERVSERARRRVAREGGREHRVERTWGSHVRALIYYTHTPTQTHTYEARGCSFCGVLAPCQYVGQQSHTRQHHHRSCITVACTGRRRGLPASVPASTNTHTLHIHTHHY